MKKFDAVLFDYDGTLMDTNEIIIKSWQYMLDKTIGKTVKPEAFSWTFGMPLGPAIEAVYDRLGYDSGSIDFDEQARIYREFQNTKMANEVCIKPFSGVRETLEALKENGVKIGIVTSRLKTSCMAGLAEYELDGFFDYVLGAEDTDIHKPKPDPALICLSKIGAKPENSMMVGDSLYDILCGKNAGCKTCFVSYSLCTSVEQANSEACPDFVISGMSELKDIVL